MSNPIRTARLDALISQKDLAEKAGITAATLSSLENDKHPASELTLAKLARALNISRVQLITPC